MKSRRKFFSILITLSILVTLLVPVFSAQAYTENRVSTVPTIASDAVGANLGWLTIREDSDYKDDLIAGKSFTVTFPTGIKLQNSVTNVVYWSNNNGAYVALDGANVTKTGDYTLDIKLPACDGNIDAIQIRPIVDVDGFEGGDIEVTVDGFDSGVTSGKYVLGRVGEGDTTTTVLEVKTIGESGKGGAIRITENSIGAIGDASQEIKLKLPANFTWNEADTDVDFLAGLSGSNVTSKTASGRTLTIVFDPVDARTQRGIIQITPAISAESDADYGEVEISIDGTKVTDADVVVAKYADFGIEITAVDEPEEVFAGQKDAELTKLKFKENVTGSFLDGRRTKVEFPDWVRIIEVKVSECKNIDQNTLQTAINNAIEKDENYIEFVVTDNGNSAKTEFKLEFTVSLKANASGDVTATVSGKSTATGEAVIGKCLAPVDAVASTIADVRIGVKGQPIGDLVISETKKEAVMDDTGDVIEVALPDNVEWSEEPTVEVIEGNLEIDEDAIDVNDSVLTIPIKSSSTKPSQIKISNITLDLDRTVPEGSIKAKIQGDALVENHKDQLPLADGGFDQAWVLKTEVARVSTPAPVDTKNVTVFTIGSTSYKINNLEATMDVAPYIKNDRTFLPIRYVALAAGVAESNIIWNEQDQSVVLIKGDRVVKITVGSTELLVNGIALTTDVAPEIVDPGRTMLPLRAIASALGCEVTWDAATQSVTVQ